MRPHLEAVASGNRIVEIEWFGVLAGHFRPAALRRPRTHMLHLVHWNRDPAPVMGLQRGIAAHVVAVTMGVDEPVQPFVFHRQRRFDVAEGFG